MTEAQADLLWFLVAGMSVAMLVLIGFVLFLAQYPPPRQRRRQDKAERVQNRDGPHE